MSISDTVKEALKPYNIRPEEIKDIDIAREDETGKEFAVFHLINGKVKTIDDPSVTQLAKYSKLDLTEEHRDLLLERLYSIHRIHKCCDKTFYEWLKDYEFKPLEELKSEVLDCEQKFEIRSRFREYLIADISRELVEKARKSAGLPVGIDRILEKLPIHKLIDMHVHLSTVKAITGWDISKDEVKYWALYPGEEETDFYTI